MYKKQQVQGRTSLPSAVAVGVTRVDAGAVIHSLDHNSFRGVAAAVGAIKVFTIAIIEGSIAAAHLVAAPTAASKLGAGVCDGSSVKTRVDVGPLVAKAAGTFVDGPAIKTVVGSSPAQIGMTSKIRLD